MIDPKSKFIEFENNKVLEIIFSDIATAVKAIKKSKKISISQAAEISLLSTEMMEQFINLINHMIDDDYTEDKESSMIESCLDFQDLCLYIKNIDKFEKGSDLNKLPNFH
jgi:predicted HTH domain antitoxin